MIAKNRLYKPGEILYVGSNYSPRYNCVGVVVADDFWLEEVIKEGKYPKEIFMKAFESESYSLVRVLGTKVFRRYWDANNPDFIDPNEEDVFNYISQGTAYCKPVDLKPFVQIREVYDGRVFGLFLDSEYGLQAINDAKIVYEYLGGKRYKTSGRDFVFSEQKFLRMLEKAIPLEK